MAVPNSPNCQESMQNLLAIDFRLLIRGFLSVPNVLEWVSESSAGSVLNAFPILVWQRLVPNLRLLCQHL